MLRQSKITAFFRPLNSSQCNNESKDENEIQIVCNTSHKLNTKRKFNKLDSNQNKSLEKNSKHLRNGRICPFYKKVPNTRFAVDAFSYGSIPEISTYFLTHFHSDHYYGLKKSFKHIIYCSPITARLVRHHFRNGLFTIKELNLNETQVIDGIEVTFIDANHCPGAVMIVFVLPNGLRYLHTGDFRASLPMHSSQYLISSPIDLIFLDTTYCDPKYDFPPQKQTLDLIVSISCEAVQKNPKLLIVCGSYSIGKENVFISIAKALNLNVWTNYNKQKVYECYRNPEINSILVSNKDHSKLHVLPMNNINPQFLQKYLQDFNGLFTEILAFTPTGWEFRTKSLNELKPRKYNNITIYGIPYSEHSSFGELKRFIKFFKPKKVIPTVNNGSEEKRKKMNGFINSWINDSDISIIDGKDEPKRQTNGSIKAWITKAVNPIVTIDD